MILSRLCFFGLYSLSFGTSIVASGERDPSPTETHNNDPEKPFIIGAGLCRTGTLSLKMALEKLDYSVMHFTELIPLDRTPMSRWIELGQAEREAGHVLPDLSREAAQGLIDEGYNAVTDNPACLLWKEFFELKPNAKVILTLKTGGAADWRQSVLATAAKGHEFFLRPPFVYFDKFRNIATILAPWIWERCGLGDLGELDPFNFGWEELDMVGAYDRWVQEVIDTIPSDQLLLHKATDGFAPVCKFLGIPDQDCPEEYPYVNERSHFDSTFHLPQMKLISDLFFPICGVLALGFLRWALQKCLRNLSVEEEKKKDD